MKRLTGLDAGFLWMETPSSAMHVAGLAVYDPSALVAAGRPFGVENVRELVRNRLHLAPPFRQRLVEVPFQLHFPLWIEDPGFHLDNHIRRVAVPAPGGPRELAELAAELDAIPLDRSRPLWEMWFIEGLEGGKVATLTKVHHAAIDGASGSEITVALFDLSPEVAEHPLPAEPWRPDKVPSDLEMLTYAAQSLARQPFRVVRAVGRTARAALSVRSFAKEEGHGLAALPFTAPATSLNGAITSARSVALATLSLTDVKRVKNAFGTTVNDVVLALCAGALRRYFDQRGEEVDGPLLAMVPISVRPEEHRTDMGNQVSALFTSLATDVGDPVERLRAIHGRMRDAKDQHRALGADVLTDWAEFAAPAVFGRAMRLYARTGLANRHRPVFNVTISNVPGPPFPLYSAGAKLQANFPLGPIYDGAALNMTVMSLEDSLDFGILTCPDVVDDVWAIGDGLRVALDELLAAVDDLEADAAELEAGRAPTSARPLASAAVGGAAPERPAVAAPAGQREARVVEVTATRATAGAPAIEAVGVPTAKEATAKEVTRTSPSTARKRSTATKATRTRTSPATKTTTAKKTTTKKTRARKTMASDAETPGNTTAAARKATAARKTPAKRTPASKTAAAKRAPASTTPAKRAPGSKTTPAKKTTAAKKTAAKKTPASKSRAAKKATAARRGSATTSPAKKTAAARKTSAARASATRTTAKEAGAGSTTAAARARPAPRTPSADGGAASNGRTAVNGSARRTGRSGGGRSTSGTPAARRAAGRVPAR